MKPRRYVAGCMVGIAILLLPSLLMADQSTDATVRKSQSNPTTAASNDNEADHEALRALVPMYEQAVNQGKPELLKPYLDPEFSGVMVTGEEVDSFASLQGYWAKIQKLIGDGGKYHVQVNVAARSLLSGDLAVAHGTTADEVITSRSKVFRFQGSWTAVCRKRDGQWKVLRIQSTMDPVSNSFVMAAIRWSSVFWGVLGCVVGLILGWLSRFWLGRRQRTGVGSAA